MRASDRLAEGGVVQPPGPLPRDIKTAIDYIRDNAGRPISMVDLAARCGVNARTLRKHFRAFMGISPLGFWRRVRLTAVRDELLNGTRDISVAEVAARAGFNHFGRFAQQYRHAFGEAPSATLLRNRRAERQRVRNSEPVENFGGDITVSLATWRDRPSLAILPCQVSGSAPECLDFAEYLTEGLTTAFSRARSLSVVAPRSLHRARVFDPKRFARELDARYVLAGRVAKNGERVRVIIRLIDGKNELQTWGDTYDGNISQLFALQDRVTEAVAVAVLTQIRACEIERAQRRPPEDLNAYGLAMQAIPLVGASSSGTAKQALDLLNRAMDIDPNYGRATALAAWCHAQLVLYNGTLSPETDQARALLLSERAGILDPGDPLVLTAQCAVHTMARHLDIAETLIERALVLDPTFVWAWERSGWLHAYAGRPDIAIRHFGQAIRLDPSPNNANRLIGIGCAHFDAGGYEEAVLWKRRGLQSQPGTAWINRTLSVSYARLGDRLAALGSIDALRRYSPDLTISEIVSSIPFTRDFLDRVAEALSDLGMPD